MKKRVDKNYPFSQAMQDEAEGAQLQVFKDLMHYKITDILLVSSLYDLHVFEEDGRMYELIRGEYRGLNLSHAPDLTRVSSGAEAIQRALAEKQRFGMIVTTLHIEDMHALTFAKKAREAGVKQPIVLLGYDRREIQELVMQRDTSDLSGIFIWQGDYRLMVAIIKVIEDLQNVDHDTKTVGVQVILVVEDNPQFYSSLLPIIYTELLHHTQKTISESVNLSHRILRMRARPKILLCHNYEEAWDCYRRYQQFILGIISDVDFPRKKKPCPDAGLDLARKVKAEWPDIPILLQSEDPTNKETANKLGAAFAQKNSPRLSEELQNFIVNNFGFGDFVFRLPDGTPLARANDMLSLEKQMAKVDVASLIYHSDRNHFSTWLKSRNEFWLAHLIRPLHKEDFDGSAEKLRECLVREISAYRKLRQRGVVGDFKKDMYDPDTDLARIGGGSLGGKARGLSFINRQLINTRLYRKYEGVRIFVPPALMLGAEVFDHFLEMNDLRRRAVESKTDDEITQIFVKASSFPQEVYNQLVDFLDMVHCPLAVRSSSLLEDSQYLPFAGVYDTYMIPNNHSSSQVRVTQLLSAIKRVYASTFHQRTKDYIKITSYRLEEEKMAVIIQKMVGRLHQKRFYPDCAGVAKSHNFYPIKPQQADDGIAALALGLGKTIVEGGLTVKFSPKHPNIFYQYGSTDEAIRNSQTEFWALQLDDTDSVDLNETTLQRHALSVAENDGALTSLASTYSFENNTVTPGLSRDGVRLVTFAPLLQYHIFPLPEILQDLLEMGRKSLGMPVEIELAFNLPQKKGDPVEFGILQLRPLVITREYDELKLDVRTPTDLICQSQQVLGHGQIEGLYDIVLVDTERFERGKTRIMAQEVSQLNSRLIAEQRPYLLIGVGRWGTLDPWLGIPVTWEQIAGARAIVEAGFQDLDVEPSQGTHFFQNITAFGVGYFTIRNHDPDSRIDWAWLQKQPAQTQLDYTRHLRFDKPMTVKMNIRENRGIILKPGKSSNDKSV